MTETGYHFKAIVCPLLSRMELLKFIIKDTWSVKELERVYGKNNLGKYILSCFP
jgi:hypothetical protein